MAFTALVTAGSLFSFGWLFTEPASVMLLPIPASREMTSWWTVDPLTLP